MIGLLSRRTQLQLRSIEPPRSWPIEWRTGSTTIGGVRSKRDLDRYTFCVAGAVGVLLSQLWKWYDGTASRRIDATDYGRGLQSVNILRNRSEDLSRNVDFFPDGWGEKEFVRYARNHLSRGDAY